MAAITPEIQTGLPDSSRFKNVRSSIHWCELYVRTIRPHRRLTAELMSSGSLLAYSGRAALMEGDVSLFAWSCVAIGMYIICRPAKKNS